jgi:hypothetical protein
MAVWGQPQSRSSDWLAAASRSMSDAVNIAKSKAAMTEQFTKNLQGVGESIKDYGELKEKDKQAKLLSDAMNVDRDALKAGEGISKYFDEYAEAYKEQGMPEQKAYELAAQHAQDKAYGFKSADDRLAEIMGQATPETQDKILARISQANQDAMAKEKMGWLRDEQSRKKQEWEDADAKKAGLDIYNQGMLAGPKSMAETLQSKGILDTKGEQAKMLAEQAMWDGEVDTEFMPENIKAADYSKLPGRESEIQQMQRVIQETEAKGLKVPQAVYNKYYKAVDDADTKLGTSYKTALEDYEQAKKDVLKSENDSIKNLISVYKANSSGGSKAVDRYSKKTNDAVKVMNELVDDGLLTSEMQGEAFKRSTELMDLYDLTPEQVKALFKYGVKKDDGILGFFEGESELDDNKIEKMKSALGITELEEVDKDAESSAVPSSIIKQIDDLRQVQMANLKAARNTFTTARDKYTKGVDRSALGEGVGTDLRELYRNVPKEVTTSSTKQTGKGGTSGSGKVEKPTEETTSEIDEVLGGVKPTVVEADELTEKQEQAFDDAFKVLDKPAGGKIKLDGNRYNFMKNVDTDNGIVKAVKDELGVDPDKMTPGQILQAINKKASQHNGLLSPALLQARNYYENEAGKGTILGSIIGDNNVNTDLGIALNAGEDFMKGVGGSTISGLSGLAADATELGVNAGRGLVGKVTGNASVLDDKYTASTLRDIEAAGDAYKKEAAKAYADIAGFDPSKVETSMDIVAAAIPVGAASRVNVAKNAAPSVISRYRTYKDNLKKLDKLQKTAELSRVGGTLNKIKDSKEAIDAIEAGVELLREGIQSRSLSKTDYTYLLDELKRISYQSGIKLPKL